MSQTRTNYLAAYEYEAHLRFKNKIGDLYEQAIEDTKDLVEQYSNAGVAAGGQFSRKAANLILARFKSLSTLFEETYIQPLQQEPEGVSEPYEKWLRTILEQVVAEQVRRAQVVMEQCCSSFGQFAQVSVHVARLQGEGDVLRRRLEDAVTLAVLSRNKQHAAPDASKELTNRTEAITPEVGLLIFISHSSRDAALAEALIDLLKSSLGVVADQIRCSSVDGYRLPVGVNTENQLREEVTAAKAVIGLVTPSSLNSHFVMFELGARWGANRFLAPLLAGVHARDLSGPLGLLNALTADNEAHLHQLLKELSKQLDLPLQNAASYVRQIKGVKQLADATVNSPVTVPVSDVPTIEENPDMNALNLWIINNFSEVQLERSALLIHGRRLLGQQAEPLPDFQTIRLTANADGLPFGVRRRFQILEFKNPSVPEFNGFVDENFVSVKLPTKGLWQIDLEIRWAGGSHRFKKCFQWDETSAPRFVACPGGKMVP